MIVAGKTTMFSIASEITEEIDGWILGRFRFEFRGRPCGNWNDTTDLLGCYSWLKEFSTNTRDRYEPELLILPPHEIFERLVTPVMPQSGEQKMPEFYNNTFSRFHISHLGMSSFNLATIILIESDTEQRCVWQADKNKPVYSDFFPSSHMQLIAKEFCELFESEIGPCKVKSVRRNV